MTKPNKTRKTPLPERGFGITFAIFFAILALAPKLLGRAGTSYWWTLGTSIVFLTLAVGWPVPLKPLRKLWLRFGILLHAVSNYVIISALFFLTITPIAVILRVLGKSPLTLRRDSCAQSYWITREPPGPSSENMKNQF